MKTLMHACQEEIHRSQTKNRKDIGGEHNEGISRNGKDGGD